MKASPTAENGEPRTGEGSFRVSHGPGLAARGVARLLRLPLPGEDQRVHLEVTRFPGGERWVRRFEDSCLITTQRWENDETMLERVGCLELRFRLEVGKGGTLYVQEGSALCLGAGRIALPRWMSPHVGARETAMGAVGRTLVKVTVSFPVVGQILEYEGVLDLQR